MLAGMNKPTPDELNVATAAQLRAEIAASDYRNPKAVAKELGMNYTTLTQNLNNKPPLKMTTIFAVLNLIGVAPGAFFTRVDERVRQG